jgi:hypothetical protein
MLSEVPSPPVKPGGTVRRGEVIEVPTPAFVAVQMESSAAARVEMRALDVQVGLPNGVTAYSTRSRTPFRRDGELHSTVIADTVPS